MRAASPEWSPANTVEWALWRCLSAADNAGFLQVLCAAELFLPGFQAADPTAPRRLLTTKNHDRAYLSVFTSAEGLYLALGDLVDGWRLTGIAELAGNWPDERWGLAVNPGLPVGGYIERDQVVAIGSILAGQPPFEPDGAAEEALRLAVRAADPGSYAAILVTVPVLVPRDGIAYDDRGPYLAVYTSERRLVEGGGDPATAVSVDFAALARDWPDPGRRLVVNRGSAIELVLDGGLVPGLSNH